MAKSEKYLQHDIEAELSAVQILLEHYKDLLDDDEEMRADLIEGQTEFLEAVDAVADEIDQLETHQEILGQRIAAMQARKKRIGERAQALRGVLITAFQVAGLNKARRPEATISIGETKPTAEIVDWTELPSQYLVQQQPKPDKKAITEALAAGEIIPGATLGEPKSKITIRRS